MSFAVVRCVNCARAEMYMYIVHDDGYGGCWIQINKKPRRLSGYLEHNTTRSSSRLCSFLGSKLTSDMVDNTYM